MGKRGWTIAVAVVLLAGGGGAAAAYQYGQDERLPSGFAVGGLQVGGWTAEQAAAAVRGRIGELAQIQVLPVDEGTEKPLPSRSMRELGLRVDASEGLAAIERYGDMTWWERALRRLKGERDETHPADIAWDAAVLEREAGKAWGDAVRRAPVDAAREINARDEVVYTPEIPGKGVDVQALAAEIRKLAPASLAAAPAAGTRSVPLPITETVPKVTLASLKAEGIDRKIAEFTTSFTTSAEGRSHNVTAAAKALNDTLLKPGDLFEYGAIVDKAGKAYGYKEAPVIVQGKLTPGIGGGICQVSSTLYNAVMQAGLDVVERRNHSLAVSYLPPGLDATYADGYVNFRFRNSTGKQLLIRTVVRDKHVTVKLFGTLDENVSYKTVTEQVKTIAPKVKYVGNDKLAPGEEKVLQKGVSGIVVDTYRIKLVNGKEVERKKMPRSTYRAQDELVAVHPGDPRLQPLDRTPPPAQDGPVEPV